MQAWYINRRRKDKRPEQVVPAVPMMLNMGGGAMSHAFMPPAAVYLPPVAPLPIVAPAPAPRKTPTKKVPSTGRIAKAPASFGQSVPSASGAQSSGSNNDYCDLIEAAKATIEGYREDGPPLGFVFDQPPMAAGAKRKVASFEHPGEYEHLQQSFGKVGQKKAGVL